MIRAMVSTEDFDPGVEIAALSQDGDGAVASFVGIVRGDGGITALHLDHYPGMTERQLEALADIANKRWPLSAVTIIHRTGQLKVGENIVFVGAASPHRTAALESCAFLIDQLKTQATFWKKEIFADGREAWVDAKESDDVAAARWDDQ